MVGVLGIDAAWTEREPSGIALLREVVEGWRCVAVAPSYDAFIDLSNGISVSWIAPIKGSAPDPARLLKAAEKMLDGESLAVVAVDMPLATVPIEGRRFADNRVTATFGARGCGTHSPSAVRPGTTGARLTEGFAALGYNLATTAVSPTSLIEVYPHPALLTLMGENYRLPYKASRSSRYWPLSTPRERSANILKVFSRIIEKLAEQIEGITLPLPDAADVTTLSSLKRFEDAIDALVCAWVGTQYLAGKAEPYGDDTAAIWIPR